MRGITGTYVLSSKKLWTPFKNSRTKLKKNLKTYSNWWKNHCLSNGTYHSQADLIWPDGPGKMYFLNFLQARVFSFFPLFLVSDLILPILCKLNGRQSRFVREGGGRGIERDDPPILPLLEIKLIPQEPPQIYNMVFWVCSFAPWTGHVRLFSFTIPCPPW